MEIFSIKNILKNRYVQLFLKPISNVILLAFLFILIPLLYALLTKNIIESITTHYVSVFLIGIFVLYFLLIIIECTINIILQKIKILNVEMIKMNI